jgi:sulfate/thiosulfate transport system substrate-binding protein
LARLCALLALLLLVGSCAAHGPSSQLLNVSYDPTRELFRDINSAFARDWREKSGMGITVGMSHGGSGKQARSVTEGLAADVVTLALAYDVDVLAEHGLVAKDWQKRFPDNSAPYTSTIVFVVRRGNPKNIRDWPDLIRPGISVITPNPRTSGGARWNFLAAWGYARRLPGGTDESARQYMAELFRHVPVLDTGARGATNTFAQRGIGDVLIAWESEALLARQTLGADKMEIVFPSVSILAEPPVAVVDANVDIHGTRKVAEAYLAFLYSPEGQEIGARHFYRPRLAEVAARHTGEFPDVHTFTIADIAGNWKAAQARFFASGGLFDQVGPGRGAKP